MRTTRQMSVTLPIELADTVRRRVESGDYASESEVIGEGLRALQEREDEIDQWLREEVAAAYDANQADPHRALPLEEAFRRIDAAIDAMDRDRGK